MVFATIILALTANCLPANIVLSVPNISFERPALGLKAKGIKLIDGKYRLQSFGGYTWIWKDRTRLEAWNKAIKERTTRDGIFVKGDPTKVKDGVLVALLQEDGAVVQIEVLEGEHTGLVGWID